MAAIVLGALLASTACSAEAAQPEVDPADFVSAGPWAAEFAEDARDASAYERKILADGVITPSELADAQSRMNSCMADYGYRYSTADDGTSEADPLSGNTPKSVETVNKYMRECSKQFDGAVTYLHNEVRRNPERLDEARIAVRCLRAAGLVDKEYSERRWRSEYDEGVFSFDEWDPAAVECRKDPLGLVKDE